HVTGVQTCALPIFLFRRQLEGIRTNGCMFFSGKNVIVIIKNIFHRSIVFSKIKEFKWCLYFNFIQKNSTFVMLNKFYAESGTCKRLHTKKRISRISCAAL